MINFVCVFYHNLKNGKKKKIAQGGVNSCFIDFQGQTITVVFNGKILAFALLSVLE